MKAFQFRFYIVAVFLLLQGCTSLTDTSSDSVSGVLVWAGSPSRDGGGMLFTTADTTYGVPGTRDDYARYFPTGKNTVEISAKVKLTGETTVRGWGARFPEGVLLRIVVL